MRSRYVLCLFDTQFIYLFQLITAGNSPVVAGAGIFDPPDDPTQAAKVQLATAAVSQYADLVRQSSVERDKMSRSSSTNSVNVPGYKTNKTFVVGAGYEDGASASSNDLQEIIQREAEKLCAEIQADAISEELVSPVDYPNKLQYVKIYILFCEMANNLLPPGIVHLYFEFNSGQIDLYYL